MNGYGKVPLQVVVAVDDEDIKGVVVVVSSPWIRRDEDNTTAVSVRDRQHESITDQVVNPVYMSIFDG